MKLFYRGVSYEYNPVKVASTESDQIDADLKYRGAAYRRGEVAKVERLGAIFNHRGVANTRSAAPAAVAASIENKARRLTLNHNRLVKNRHDSILSRSAANIGVNFAAANQMTY